VSPRSAYGAVVLGSAALLAWALVDLSSLRLAVALLLCLLVPGLGWAQKLRTADLGDTVALGVALSLCATTAVATTMAVTAHWSTPAGMAALAAITVLGFLPLRRVLASTLRVVAPPPTLLDESESQAWTDWYDEQRRRSAERRQHELAVAEERARSWSDWYATAEGAPVQHRDVSTGPPPPGPGADGPPGNARA
jgi:hypothetical protein